MSDTKRSSKTSNKKNSSQKKKKTLFFIITGGSIFVVLFITLIILTALKVIHIPLLNGDSFSIELSKESNQKTSTNNHSKNEKPDYLDPDSMTDDEIKDSVDQLLQPVDADEYFDKIGTIIEKIPVSSAEGITSETETIKLMIERGFDGKSILTEYNMYGDYSSEVEISGGYADHPEYTMQYIDKSGRYWSIHILNGVLFSVLVSDGTDNLIKPTIIITEDNYVLGYDSDSNTYYKYTPDPDKAKMSVVPAITAEALDAFKV